jgi:hypothetical protein
MLGVREAVECAKNYLHALYDPEELQGLRVEEIKPAESGNRLHITLGWIEPDVRSISVPAIYPRTELLVPEPRVYKVLDVDRETGQVLAMLMRR